MTQRHAGPNPSKSREIQLNMIRPLLALTGVLVLLIAMVDSQTAGAARLRAGAHKVDFTPKVSDLQTPTDSIRDQLYARAIVVDDGTMCAVLVGIDLGATPNQIVDDAMARVSKATGCPAQNIIISATHTHSSNTHGLGQGAPTAKTVADAIVEAATVAKSKLAPARIGYGTTKVDVNVNRDLFTRNFEWRQEPNPDGPSDKTLAVVALLGNDNVPVGVFLNYAMHPVNFYQSGVISADFPGEASRYVEELYDDRTVAIFSQGASGDQNPRDFRTSAGFNRQRTSAEAYKKVLARTGDHVRMLGMFIGTSAARVMRESMQPTDVARIWAAQETFACPGRIRLDADNPARENVFPGYKDGPDVNLKVGLLRVGDIHFTTVNGEVYSEIATRLKAEAPASKTIVVTLANGFANSGYIYSDAAYSHLTFQVIGSRLKPGCAEGKIVSTALDLMRRSVQ
jgi:neutral ceramidase